MEDEGREECIFGNREYPACDSAVMQPTHGTESEKQIDRSDEEGNMPVMPSRTN